MSINVSLMPTPLRRPDLPLGSTPEEETSIPLAPTMESDPGKVPFMASHQVNIDEVDMSASTGDLGSSAKKNYPVAIFVIDM